MILVTGATGTIGSVVLRLLRERGHPVRAMTRTPARITTTASAAGSGAGPVEVVQADYADPASLRRAVVGIEAVFLLTAPASPTYRHDLALLEAAGAARVVRIVKLSAIGTGERFGADQVVGEWHLRAEEAIRDSGLAWTLLRPSSFASNTLHWAGAVAAGAPVPNLTGSGRQGVVDPRDVAEVAVAALTTEGHGGRTYTLTGPTAISVPEQAGVLAEVLGRRVGTVEPSAEEVRRQLTAAGLGPAGVRATLLGSAWARSGGNEIVTDEVPRLLGRPAATFRTWARDHRAAFGAAAAG